MEQRKERVFRGYLSSADVERLYPARVARIARGELTYADRGRINEEVSSIDQEWRGGRFNGIEYFHFRFPHQGARMAAFLMKQRLHRLVPGSSRAPTPEDVDAEWARLAREREAILSWARSTRMLIEIVQAYTRMPWWQGISGDVRLKLLGYACPHNCAERSSY
jgi:hypothetical protein